MVTEEESNDSIVIPRPNQDDRTVNATGQQAASTKGLLDHFSGLEIPRQAKRLWYPLDAILLLVLCAVISGADGWVDVATFGKK